MFSKKGALEIPKSSQEHICIGFPFFREVAGLRPQSRSPSEVFFCKLFEIFLNNHSVKYYGRVFQEKSNKIGRPYPFKFFKGCLPQILLGPFLNTLSHLIFQMHFSLFNMSYWGLHYSFLFRCIYWDFCVFWKLQAITSFEKFTAESFDISLLIYFLNKRGEKLFRYKLHKFLVKNSDR